MVRLHRQDVARPHSCPIPWVGLSWTSSFHEMCRIAFLGAVAFVAACDAPSQTAPIAEVARPPALLGTAQAGVDPYDLDAAVGARAQALFSTCSGGPETACHSMGAGGLRLQLGPGGDLLNVRSTERPDMVRVRPFDPPSSYLYLKVIGDGGIEGGRMPLDGVADARTVALVERWIEAGAPSP